jgi:CopG family transcriptional regulator, nickel-responsive regulator
MQRITVTIDDELAQEIDKLAQARGYQNRSEAVRDLVRAGIVQTEPRTSGGVSSSCVATLTYVYDQGMRDLPKRLGAAFRNHHDLPVATMRVALDHDSCMEVSVLRGATARVERFAQSVIAERGVRHGRVMIVPAAIGEERHAHGGGQAHVHQHIRVG